MDINLLIVLITMGGLVYLVLKYRPGWFQTGTKKAEKSGTAKINPKVRLLKSMPIASQRTLDRWDSEINYAITVNSLQRAKNLINHGYKSPPPPMKNLTIDMMTNLFENWKFGYSVDPPPKKLK